jgi:hypothetical protein
MGFLDLFRRKKEEPLKKNLPTIEVPTEILVGGEDIYKLKKPEFDKEERPLPETIKPESIEYESEPEIEPLPEISEPEVQYPIQRPVISQQEVEAIKTEVAETRESKEKPPEFEPNIEVVKPDEEDKTLVASWVNQINQSLLEVKEELKKANFELDEVQKPIIDKLDSFYGEMSNKVTQPILKKLEETRLPVETVVNEIKKGVTDELSKFRLSQEQFKSSKPLLAQKLEKRIDQVANSLIPKHILDLLFKTESMTFTELLEATGTTKPTLARYLNVLLRAGKIEKARIGKYAYYRIPPIQIKVTS